MYFTPDVVPDMPGVCAVTGKAEDPAGFVHTGNTLNGWDPRIQVSVEGLKLLEAELPRDKSPFVPKELYQELATKLELAQAEAEALRTFAEDAQKQAADAARKLEAIDLIESAGFRARKKAGRPPTKTKQPA